MLPEAVVISDPLHQFNLAQNYQRQALTPCCFAGVSSRISSFTLTNQCSWQHDQLQAATQSPSDTAQTDGHPLNDTAHSAILQTACQHNLSALFKDAWQLLPVAEEIIRQSCQEDWLLQPYIADLQEYRQALYGQLVA